MKLPMKLPRALSRFLSLPLALGLVLIFFSGDLLGWVLTPFLEKQMTRAFDMPVHVKGLRIGFWPASLRADKIECLNLPAFRRRDHWTGKGIDVELDLKYIKNKFIHIKRARVRELVFAIESVMTPRGPDTNVLHWYYHMGLDQDTPQPVPPHPAPPPDNAGEDHWRVRIDRLELQKGSFVYDDRCFSPERHWIFENLKGYWTGFDYISDYTSPVFTETIKLEGTFGKNPPARFAGEGKCQFADGDNFDLQAGITDGSAAEYGFLLEGLPGDVRGGNFDLKSKLHCIKSHLDSNHRLTLRSLRFGSPNAAKKILQYPLDGVVLLLETQKTVELDMKVDGYILDPKFRFFSAFTQALQKGLVDKTKMTLEGVGKGTLLVATETPKQVTQGLVKVASILTDPFVPKTEESPRTLKNGLSKLASILTDPFASKTETTNPNDGGISHG